MFESTCHFQNVSVMTRSGGVSLLSSLSVPTVARTVCLPSDGAEQDERTPYWLSRLFVLRAKSSTWADGIVIPDAKTVSHMLIPGCA